MAERPRARAATGRALLDHVSIAVRDLARVRPFYRAVMAALGAPEDAAGLRAGGRDGGPPGPRPDNHAGYYAAFLLDPGGNRIEFVTHRGDDAA